MALSHEQLSSLKTLLEDEKMKLEHELSLLGKKVGQGNYEAQITDMGDHEDEAASEVEEYVDTLAVEATLEHQLSEVEAALVRMEAGTYGICEKTGQDIAYERLAVYPSARIAIV
jgi:DnaK suppressor protein